MQSMQAAFEGLFSDKFDKFYFLILGCEGISEPVFYDSKDRVTTWHDV